LPQELREQVENASTEATKREAIRAVLEYVKREFPDSIPAGESDDRTECTLLQH